MPSRGPYLTALQEFLDSHLGTSYVDGRADHEACRSGRATTMSTPRQPNRARPLRRRTAAMVVVVVAVLMATLASLPMVPTAAGAAPTADTGATVIGESWVDGRTLDLTIRSPSTEWPNGHVRLLLPPGWSKDAARRWPTLYLLHGGTDGYRSWWSKTDVEQLAANRQAIIVLPDTSWCSAYSDWWNYGNGGRPKWDTYVTTEVPQILERGYRANTTRAIAGNSMGGL